MVSNNYCRDNKESKISNMNLYTKSVVSDILYRNPNSIIGNIVDRDIHHNIAIRVSTYYVTSYQFNFKDYIFRTCITTLKKKF